MSVSKLVKKMRAMLNEAETHEDLQAIIQLAIGYGKPIRYNNMPLCLAFLIISAVAALSWYLYRYSVIWLVAAIIVALVPLIIAIVRSLKLRNLENDLFLRDAIYDNGMRPINPPSLAELDNRYAEFIRGNHTREIMYYVEGERQKEKHTLKYCVYKFHYVIKRKTKKSYSYSHYYRYGMILDNFTADSMQIMSSGVPTYYPVEWTTESIYFNKRFRVCRRRDKRS